MDQEKCVRCGSVDVTEGYVDDASVVVRIPRFRFVLSDSVSMKAIVCLECGHVSLSVDPEKVRAILGNSQKEDAVGHMDARS